MDLLKKAGKPEIEPGDEENKMEKAAEEEMEEKDNAETHNNADVGAGKRSEMDIAESVELFGKKFFQEFQPHLHTALQTRSPTVLTSGTNTSSPPAQLTIFYSGTVSIFDAVTPEKNFQLQGDTPFSASWRSDETGW
uniref:Tify domain-containing protein n=1 Tax=Nelumbo nucifera TaxID=4432 RepID=A0A822ZNL8_NELNU|nr:TPA_asm: hypothetical protein HUJ06_016330 [Nelumbo nucifera]